MNLRMTDGDVKAFAKQYVTATFTDDYNILLEGNYRGLKASIQVSTFANSNVATHIRVALHSMANHMIARDLESR